MEATSNICQPGKKYCERIENLAFYEYFVGFLSISLYAPKGRWTVWADTLCVERVHRPRQNTKEKAWIIFSEASNFFHGLAWRGWGYNLSSHSRYYHRKMLTYIGLYHIITTLYTYGRQDKNPAQKGKDKTEKRDGGKSWKLNHRARNLS